MYVVRHFGLIAWMATMNSVKPRFWLRGMWVWLCLDAVGWSAGVLLLPFPARRRAECECCGWRGRQFFLHTVVSGTKVHRFKEEVCPICGALKRQRQLARYLAGKVGDSVPTTARILEIGPGRGELEWFRKRGLARVLRVDVWPGIATLFVDMTRLAVREGVSDVMISNQVLEHVPQDLNLMGLREMH